MKQRLCCLTATTLILLTILTGLSGIVHADRGITSTDVRLVMLDALFN